MCWLYYCYLYIDFCLCKIFFESWMIEYEPINAINFITPMTVWSISNCSVNLCSPFLLIILANFKLNRPISSLSSRTLIMHYFNDLGTLNNSISSSHEGGLYEPLSLWLWVLNTSSPATTWILTFILLNIDDLLLKLAYINFNPTTTIGCSINSNIILRNPTFLVPLLRNNFFLHRHNFDC